VLIPEENWVVVELELICGTWEDRPEITDEDEIPREAIGTATRADEVVLIPEGIRTAGELELLDKAGDERLAIVDVGEAVGDTDGLATTKLEEIVLLPEEI